MRHLLIAFAVLGTSAATTPAIAQVTPAPADTREVQVKTVKKVVCERIEEERSTGSRLNATTKVCREVTVTEPVGKAAQQGDTSAR